MIKIALLGTKGGPGKSTTATNLAGAALAAGLRVSLIDLDKQGNSFKWGVTRQRTRDEGEFLVHSTQFVGLDDVLADDQRQAVDVAILDTPGDAGVEAAGVISTANLLLTPCRPSPFDIDTMPTVQRLCAMFDRTTNVMLNQTVHNHAQLTSIARSDLLALRMHVIEPTLSLRVDYLKCIYSGECVIEFDPRGDAAAEVRTLFNWIVTTLNVDWPQFIAEPVAVAPERKRARKTAAAGGRR